jgi:hypothetical protein
MMNRERPKVKKGTIEAPADRQIVDMLYFVKMPEEYGWLGIARLGQTMILFKVPDGTPWHEVRSAIYAMLPPKIDSREVWVNSNSFIGYLNATGRNVRRLIKTLAKDFKNFQGYEPTLDYAEALPNGTDRIHQ